jgi:uracil-DNA glycosylase
MTKEEYFGDWLKIIDGKEMQQTLLNVSKKYSKSGGCCPDYKDIFKAFNLCDYNSLKSVWVGMDPYPDKRFATGLLFANPPGLNIEAPSLRIIKDAIYRATGKEIKDNSLESLASQGILMINYCLTTEEDKSGTDILIWMPFVVHLIKRLSEINSGIVYIFFGRLAQMLAPHVNRNSNTVLMEKHPAYYSRQKQSMPCDVFKTLDTEIKDRYGESITWK